MSGVGGIFKIGELRRRILFSLAIVAIYRLGVHVPTPGIDRHALETLFAQYNSTILGMFNLLGGGAFSRLSIFALGIMPYISSSIIFQLLGVISPYIEQLQKEGELGRKKITQYTRYGTIVLSIVQGFAISTWLERTPIQGGIPIVLEPGWAFRCMTVLTLTTGTSLIMWLGEQITNRGIGNGISLIIFSSIAASIPHGVSAAFSEYNKGNMSVFMLVFLAIMIVGVMAFVILMERGQRRIPIQYANRVVGRRMVGVQSTHLPLRINVSGVIPPIFASSVIAFPATLAQFTGNKFFVTVQELLSPGTVGYEVLFAGFIVFFAFFYTAIVFNPVDIADNIKKQGGYVPGIRPGKPTSDYLDKVLTRVTLGGAVYLCFICVLPSVLMSQARTPFYFGGTSLLILIGVALDTIQQIESHLLARHYEGFMKQARMKGRRG